MHLFFDKQTDEQSVGVTTTKRYNDEECNANYDENNDKTDDDRTRKMMLLPLMILMSIKIVTVWPH